MNKFCFITLSLFNVIVPSDDIVNKFCFITLSLFNVIVPHDDTVNNFVSSQYAYLMLLFPVMIQ